MKIEEELAEFLNKNYLNIHNDSLKFRIDSIDILLNHRFTHFFKPLVIIINPTNGYTPAFQDQFVDNLYNLAGPLAGYISVYTASEMNNHVLNCFLTSAELAVIDHSKIPLDYFCGNPNGASCR